jgi:hypothetical protein
MTVEQNELEMANQKEERKRLEAIYWAGVFIWAGLVFGADSLGILPQIGGADAWSWVFFGAGLYALVGALFRVVSPDLPAPTAWDYIWAAFLLIVGLGGVVNVDVAFPVILVIAGVAVLGNALLRRD